MDDAQALLSFWFGTPDCEARWFKADPEFDRALGERFGPLVPRAAAGELDPWAAAPEGALALLLLLDQLPRNLYRGSARAFASDLQARAVARAAIEAGFDRAVPPLKRQFFYLPFEHSEALADQEEAVRLFAALPPGAFRDDCLDWARRHRGVIARFGRFPHRNAALGRASSAAEQAFLESADAPFRP
jgi:uncharacterized protein (DUF924 family)